MSKSEKKNEKNNYYFKFANKSNCHLLQPKKVTYHLVPKTFGFE